MKECPYENLLDLKLTKIQNYLPLPLLSLPPFVNIRSVSFSGTSYKWSYSQWKEPMPKVSDRNSTIKSCISAWGKYAEILSHPCQLFLPFQE